jgi:septal ring factor EnvC (AmiA/AmiB activator)
MTGHHKFSQLTQEFSEERQSVIAQKTEQIKQKIKDSKQKQTTLSDELKHQEKADLEVKQ